MKTPIIHKGKLYFCIISRDASNSYFGIYPDPKDKDTIAFYKTKKTAMKHRPNGSPIICAAMDRDGKMYMYHQEIFVTVRRNPNPFL